MDRLKNALGMPVASFGPCSWRQLMAMRARVGEALCSAYTLRVAAQLKGGCPDCRPATVRLASWAVAKGVYGSS